MTYEQAIQQLTEMDVAKWGEGERAAAERLNRRHCQTLGLALNRIAHYDPNHVDVALAAKARRMFTAADIRLLRAGG